MKRRIYIAAAVFIALIAVVIIANKPWEHSADKLEITEDGRHQIDSYQMDIATAVTLALDDFAQLYPSQKIEALYEYKPIHKERMLFRSLLNNHLFGTNRPMADIIQSTNERKREIEKLVTEAQDEYDITVTEEEVTAYIEEMVDPHYFEEQEAYAAALGIGVAELNHQFDRDLYYFDVLADKLLFARAAEGQFD
ncbi:hypothetical protein M3212_12830 [Alkalihalobacillus oceani]|uniref:hypothetical protein n=1 Tax=Halalkalibacter oceani TaxID=1653776 RepID=UPI002040AC6C|nr:hypothetical protein [Halalkalibacter oceani]MCM3761672.1 hypothetical protein [Halalkalibacter oceani]